MMMRAIEISSFGPPDVLRIVERPIPSPKPGHVLVKVIAFSVNRADILQRRGQYSVTNNTTNVLGLDVSGVIISGDFSGYNPFCLSIGDLICAILDGGGYAEYVIVPLAHCLPIPIESIVESAALPEVCYTVWKSLFILGNLKKNDGIAKRVLIHGGGSGVGTMAIQIACAFGHQVYVTAGTNKKCLYCEQLGAQKAFNYKKNDFFEKIRETTNGLDCILDMVGGEYVTKNLSILNEDGCLVCLSTRRGSNITFDLLDFMKKRLTITGVMIRYCSKEDKIFLTQMLYQYVWPLFHAQRIKPIIYRVFSAYDIVEAHRLMQSGVHIGKLILVW